MTWISNQVWAVRNDVDKLGNVAGQFNVNSEIEISK